MSEIKLVGDMSEWSGMLMDLFRQIRDGSKTKQMLQAFLEHRNPFAITDISQEWQKFYRKYFRLAVDFSDVAIPDNPGGFDRVIFIPQGLTHANVIKSMRKKFEVSLYTEDLDKAVTENIRIANKSYAIRLRERQEADEEWKNTSANQLKQQNVNCITLLERLVYEFKHFDETSEHLDITNWTLCAGSRSSHGDVPEVHWRSGRCLLRVDWYCSDDANGAVRVRQAVS